MGGSSCSSGSLAELFRAPRLAFAALAERSRSTAALRQFQNDIPVAYQNTYCRLLKLAEASLSNKTSSGPSEGLMRL